jgi:preprotein translocase subunit SecG
VFGILITIHVLICIALILVILMQSSKGEGLAGAFGGTSLSGAVFGGRGAATFLSKATSYIAVGFFLSCIALTFVSPARQAARQQSAVKKQLEQAPPMMPGEPSALPGEAPAQSGSDIELPPPPAENQNPPPEGGQ